MFSLIAAALLAAPMPVRFAPTEGGWQLLRGDQPYYVKGAGCSSSTDATFAALKAAGGNSVRTWGAERAGEILDLAHKHGLTVTVGIWLGHVGHGFDYNDPARVKRQFDEAREVIRKHRDHPALLMWALGNEMEINNNTPVLWKAVGDLARMAQEEDPNHPAISVVAELGGDKWDLIKRYAPDLDGIGINSYGGLDSLAGRLAEMKFDKPYLVTEWGPNGPWEVGKTAWGAALEPTSTEKGAMYARRYADGIWAQRPRCLGSYVFLWGNKQEETSTWFGMALPTGEKVASTDEIQRAWTGSYPANRAPAVEGLKLEPATPEAGKPLRVSVTSSDPESDPLEYEWTIQPEVRERRRDGEGEKVDPALLSIRTNVPRALLRVPSVPGRYRLMLVVRDGKGSAATANAPFRLE